MKFKTTDLIERIDAILAILAIQEAEQHAKSADAEAKEYEARQAWVGQHSTAWSVFSALIAKRVRNDEPVTFEDAPESIRESYRRSLNFYTAPSAWSRDDTQNKSLKKLRNALQASQEDTVSPTAIKQLGFQDVTFLFTAEAAK